MIDLSVEICGISFKTPIIAASGTFGFGKEMQQFYPLSRLGGISVKGLTLEPREGNKAPRIAETNMGILNSVGLQNPGIKAFKKDLLPWLLTQDTVIIANIAGNTIDEYCQMARQLSDTGVHMMEMNISCPNVKQGGVQFGTQPDAVYKITNEVKKFCRQPLIVKLSPNTADIQATAKAAEDGGADVLSLINTVTGMAIDPYTRKPILGNIIGGLSGPAIKPIALRMVYEAAKIVKIPLIGMGGIYKGTDVAEFMLAGSSAIMVGSANLSDPTACLKIENEFVNYLTNTKIQHAGDLTNGLII